MAKQQQLAPDQVIVHAILDGRDTPPRSGAGYLQDVQAEIARVGVGRIGTVMGRYYAMDRDNRQERTQRAFRAYVAGEGQQAGSPAEAIAASYAAGKGDEFVEPYVIGDSRVDDADGLIFFNFRPDRARQITRAFLEGPVRVHYVCMTEYDARLPAPVAFRETVA